MILTSLFFGSILAVTLFTLLLKLPPRIKEFLRTHTLTTEVLSMLAVAGAVTSITQSLMGVMIALSAELIFTGIYLSWKRITS
jgi:hypothetical protein